MVSSVCRASYPSMSPQLSTPRKLHIDPQKDYSSPLQVETSVEYDLPSHIYPPKGSEPILMIHPAYVSTVRARSRAVVLPTPTAMLATSGSARTLTPLHLSNLNQQSRSSQIRAAVTRSWCACGNPHCDANLKNNTSSARNGATLSSAALPRNSAEAGAVYLQQQQQMWNSSNRCVGPCCNPRPTAMAPVPVEFVVPGLPASLFTRTPARGSAGGSPKIRAARTRRVLSVANSVNLPEYLSSSRTARVSTGGAMHAHGRARTLSSSMGALVATPAPQLGQQLTPSMDFARTTSLAPLYSQHNSLTGSNSSLLYTVGLSRDSGCSVGADGATADWMTDRTRGLVDSGFCTPVDASDECMTDSLMLSSSWKEFPASLPPSLVAGSGHTSLIAGASHAQTAHHYLPQPLWNLVY